MESSDPKAQPAAAAGAPPALALFLLSNSEYDQTDTPVFPDLPMAAQDKEELINLFAE